MKTQITLFSIVTVLLTECDPATYVSNKHYFKEDYSISSVNAPSYPFSDEPNETPINISFPKQGEFSLQLSANTCGGQYNASKDGTISFTNTNCTLSCCESGWDHYILTLLRKSTRYEGGEDGPLYLYIDNKNYLILDISLDEGFIPTDN